MRVNRVTLALAGHVSLTSTTGPERLRPVAEKSAGNSAHLFGEPFRGSSVAETCIRQDAPATPASDSLDDLRARPHLGRSRKAAKPNPRVPQPGFRPIPHPQRLRMHPRRGDARVPKHTHGPQGRA